MLQVGALLAGKYRVERVLGQGGMGVVVAAVHMQRNQRVALKFLLPDMMENRELVARFLREARASAQLRGEHVCRVSDVGTLDTGAPYMVMELLRGHDLATLVSRSGPMSVPVAVGHVLQACLGIGEAHALGVVHRDLKPANLFLARRPDGSSIIKVLDFGIAKAQRDGGIHLTRTSSLLGSPGHMSPEQLRSSRDCDVRSDIWSLGIILYELVAGRPPFHGESITEIALHIAMDATPPIPVAGLPPGFEAVVQRCLAKDPAQRYPDVASLAAALAPFGGPGAHEAAAGVARLLQVALATPELAAATVPPTVSPTPVPTTLGPAVRATTGTAARARSRRGLVVAIGALGAIALGAIAVVAISRGAGPGDSGLSPAPASAAAASASASPAPAELPLVAPAGSAASAGPAPDAGTGVAGSSMDAAAAGEAPDHGASAGAGLDDRPGRHRAGRRP